MPVKLGLDAKRFHNAGTDANPTWDEIHAVIQRGVPVFPVLPSRTRPLQVSTQAIAAIRLTALPKKFRKILLPADSRLIGFSHKGVELIAESTISE